MLRLDIEKVMYDFLQGCKSLYKGKIILKGCMALKEHLNEKGNDNFRITQDIDFSIDNHNHWEMYVRNCCDKATENSKIGAKYELIKRRGFSKNPNSDSITINAKLPDDVIFRFKIDMNVKPQDLKTVDAGSCIDLYSIYGILKDKINVITTRKVCRRVKDLIDVYQIVTTMDIDYNKMIDSLEYDNKVVNYLTKTESRQEIKHAFDKYENINKPDFDEMMRVVLTFTLPIIYEKTYGRSIYKYVKWDYKKGSWV